MSKLTTMREAIGAAVNDGDSVLIDGFTHLICFAAGHEIIRQRKRDLVAIRLTPDVVYDQMIEAGCVKKLIFSWAGNPGVGSLHALRRKTEARYDERIEIDEYSHFGLLCRLLAGSKGLPFWPLNNFGGSDLPAANPEHIGTVTCPFTGQKLAAVPALRPDVAVVHCQRADADGNAQVWGLMASQKEVAFASKKVIVVAEEIVPTDVIRRDPNRTTVPGIIVDHVVHEPFGCHPSYVQGYYDRDNDFYVQWDEICREPETVAAWLEAWVYNVADRAEYMAKMGARVAELKATPRMCEGVDYGY